MLNVQATATLVTLALAVPLPFVTVQVWPGWRLREDRDAVGAPLAIAVVNVKLPSALTARLLPPLSCKTSPVPESPETVPPMV